MKKKIRSAYSPQHRVTLPEQPFDPEAAVSQEFKNDVDINEIVSRAQRGMQPPSWLKRRQEIYSEEIIPAANYQDAFAIVEHAKEMFDTLPLAFRRELDHDPRNLQFATRELFAKHGLLNKVPEDESFVPENSAPGTQPSPQGRGSVPPIEDDGKNAPSEAPGAKNTAPGSKGKK